MKTILNWIHQTLSRAWRRRELERELARLDARMLRDIGLESWRSDQAARLWAHRGGLY
jgi:hypothetical protein